MSIVYSIEYAKSNRSKCKGSKETIDKGEIRIAKITEMARGDDEPVQMSAWYKPLPFFQMMKRMKKTSAKVESSSDVAGYDDLEEEDQVKIEKMIADFHDPDVDFPPKPPPAAKKRKPEDEDEDEDAKPAAKKPVAAKKKAKEGLAAIEPETRVVENKEMRALAEEIVSRSRARGVALPPDDDAARKLVAGSIMAERTGTTVDIAAVLASVETQFGVQKTIDVECADNSGLALAFSELSERSFKSGDTMKGVAFKKVTAQLVSQTEPITSGKQALKLKDIGKSSASMIDEFLESGKIKKLEDLKNAA